MPNPSAPLREQFREVMPFLHYSERTEETYLHWIRRFIMWSDARLPMPDA